MVRYGWYGYGIPYQPVPISGTGTENPYRHVPLSGTGTEKPYQPVPTRTEPYQRIGTETPAVYCILFLLLALQNYKIWLIQIIQDGMEIKELMGLVIRWIKAGSFPLEYIIWIGYENV